MFLTEYLLCIILFSFSSCVFTHPYLPFLRYSGPVRGEKTCLAVPRRRLERVPMEN